MAEKEVPPTERIAASFKELALISPEVESAALDLANSISALEKYLRRTGIQVSAWHQISGDEDEDGFYWSRDIGWAHIEKTWSIGIRKTEGSNRYDHHTEEIWPFRDAPKWMCIEAVSKLPDLLETLNKRSKDTIDKLKARKRDADELAAAIEAVIPETAQQVKALKKGIIQ